MAKKKSAKKKTAKKTARKTSGSKAGRKSASKPKSKSKKTAKSSTRVAKTAKKAAKKSSRTSTKKVGRNAGLSSKELRRFRELLIAKRATLLGDVTSMTNEALGKNRQDASGDLSNMPIHMADIGSDNYEQEFTLGLLESERKLLHEIDAALQRMVEGTYGVCLGTGMAIGTLRLEAKPWAKYHIEYARQVEKGLAPDINGDDEEEQSDEDEDDDE